MKKELIAELFEKFERASNMVEGVECWSARELRQILNYSKWDNFVKVIDKARKACENAGERIADHFADVGKMIGIAKGAQRNIIDIALTRYACYLIAQNADPAKNEAVLLHEGFKSNNHLISETKLSRIIFNRGVDEKGFAIIRSKGDEALFGGFSTNDMKRKLSVPATRPLADFLPTLTIKAKDFATELTSHNVLEKDLQGEVQITTEHIDNNLAVRSILIERGVKPETLPAAEDVKKVQRRLETDEKKLLEEIKKPQK